MPTLTLLFMDKELGVYKIEKGKPITIGRHDDNDIVIENLGASSHHAKIDDIKGSFLFTDLESTNGSFINEERVVSRRLKKGDVITIAKHSLIFNYEEGEEEPEDLAATMNKTMVMDTKEHRAMLEKKTVTQPADAQEKKKVATLSFLTGQYGEKPLTKKMTKIGKGADADIVVKGLLIGDTVATISSRPNGYYLSYVGGMTKPKVNGSIVKQTVKLNEFDVIEIGPVKAEFYFKE